MRIQEISLKSSHMHTNYISNESRKMNLTKFSNESRELKTIFMINTTPKTLKKTNITKFSDFYFLLILLFGTFSFSLPRLVFEVFIFIILPIHLHEVLQIKLATHNPVICKTQVVRPRALS